MSCCFKTVFLLSIAAYRDVRCTPPTDWHFRGSNIALNKRAYQEPGTLVDGGSPSSNGYTARLAVDGNDDSKFTGGSCSHTTGSLYGTQQHNPQWTVFLGDNFYVTGITIVNRKDLKYRLKHFLVFGFNNILQVYPQGWCQLYNDTLNDRYLRDRIDVQVDTGMSYSKIAINLPKYYSAKDNGSTYLTLCEVKIYAAPRPSCGIIRNIVNGDINISTGETVRGQYLAGTVLKVTCKAGYLMTGSGNIKCLPDGNFDPKIPVCNVACKYRIITNGYMKPNRTLFGVFSKAIISCDEGYHPSSQEVTCSNTGFWNSYPKCSKVQCDHPGEIENGHYILGTNGKMYSTRSSLPFNSSIIVKCDTGYESEDNDVRNCQSNKMWSGIQPVCKQKQCPYPGNITNGVYRFKNDSVYAVGSSLYNTTINVKCNKGFKLNGSKERSCDENESWGRKALCQIVTCAFPEIPENGWYTTKDNNGTSIPFSSEQSYYQDIIHAKCPKGNVYNSTSKDRQCLETGKWSGESGRCVLVTCQMLGELNGGFNNYTNAALPEGFPYDTVATTNCHESFRLSSPQQRSRRCTEEGEWDNEPTVCISVVTEADAEQSSNAGLIGGLSGAAVILISVAVVGFFLYRRRMRHGNKGEKPKRYATLTKKNARTNVLANTNEGVYAEIQEESCTSLADNTPSRVSITRGNQSAEHVYSVAYSLAMEDEPMGPSLASSASLQSQQAYYSFTNVNKIPKTALIVKDLPDLVLTGYVAKAKFEKEFQNLPQGMVEAHKEALKRKNIGKNRYKNLYAYDETRVVLDTDDDSQSNYINACYVHGFKKVKQYIASQGPTEEILLDFWRMIWQTGSSKIVMLTNLIEEGKNKCEKYWPAEDSCETFGRIKVTTKKTESFSQFVIRTLQVEKENSKHKPRTITQFHFTAWPDKGVPKYASSLVHFINKVKYGPVYGKGPIIVHCSAGVGRTGTFIALDYLTEQGKTMGYVDIVSTVASLRTQRVSLVQTLEQYIFVHNALVEALMLSTSALPAGQFPDAFQELLQMDTEKNTRKIYVEFETLKKVSPVADESEYVSSKMVRNRQKNRYSNVLPVEEFMPSLMSDNNNADSRYINAVVLSSYKEPKAFIITQTPLESTRDDFWSLVWEHDVHTIVMMNDIREATEPERYWPDKGEATAFGNIKITNDGGKEINEHQVVSLSVNKYKVTRKVKQIRCGGWHQKHSLPDSPEAILTLLELVQASQQQSGNHTILVHCMNGADKSGLFCVISAVIERMKIEQDVAISQVIEQMRNAREQVIPSVEQYQFCHEVVLAYIHQYDTYSNFTA